MLTQQQKNEQVLMLGAVRGAENPHRRANQQQEQLHS